MQFIYPYRPVFAPQNHRTATNGERHDKTSKSYDSVNICALKLLTASRIYNILIHSELRDTSFHTAKQAIWPCYTGRFAIQNGLYRNAKRQTTDSHWPMPHFSCIFATIAPGWLPPRRDNKKPAAGVWRRALFIASKMEACEASLHFVERYGRVEAALHGFPP